MPGSYWAADALYTDHATRIGSGRDSSHLHGRPHHRRPCPRQRPRDHARAGPSALLPDPAPEPQPRGEVEGVVRGEQELRAAQAGTQAYTPSLVAVIVP